jgi:hypothetical protein
MRDQPILLTAAVVQPAPLLVMQPAPAAAPADTAGPETSNQLLQRLPVAALNASDRAAYSGQQQQQLGVCTGVNRLLCWANKQMQQQGRQQQLPNRVRLSQLVAAAITHSDDTATAGCVLQLYMVGRADPSVTTAAEAGSIAAAAPAATHSAEVKVQGFVLDAPVVTKALAAAQGTVATASSGASSSSAAAASAAAAAAGSSYYMGSLTPEQQQQQGLAAVAASMAVVQHPDGSVALLTDLPCHLTVQQAAAAAVLPGSEIWDASDLQLQRRLAAVDAELSMRLAAACAMPSRVGDATPFADAAAVHVASSSSRMGAGVQTESAAAVACGSRGSVGVTESGEKGSSTGLEVGGGVGCSNISRMPGGDSGVGKGGTSIGDSVVNYTRDRGGQVREQLQQQQLHQHHVDAASAGWGLATADAALAASDTQGSSVAPAGDPAAARAVTPPAGAAGAAVTAPAAAAAEDFAERLRRLDAAYTQAMQQRLAGGGGEQ